jgi:hypothetical protein
MAKCKWYKSKFQPCKDFHPFYTIVQKKNSNNIYLGCCGAIIDSYRTIGVKK